MRQFAEIWSFRHFLMALVRLDLRQRYSRAALGLSWSIIQPAAFSAVFVLVFSQVLNTSPASYMTTLLIGLAVWNFFRECAVSGCLAFVSHESYIRQRPLPYGLYTARCVIGYAIHSSFAFAVALVAVVMVNGHAEHLLTLWAVVPILLMILIAGWAVATIFAFAQVYFHDTKHLLEVLTQMLFFLTPIVYPPSLLVNKGLGWLARFNPLNVYLELVRYPLTTGELPDAKLVIYGLACTVMLVGMALATISAFQKRLVYRM